MQKFTRSLFAVGAVLGLAACGDDVSVTPPQEPLPAGIASVTVAPASVSIAVGESVALTASVATTQGTGSPATTVTWSSATPAIATVNATGVVTGVAAGTTTIRATSTADAGKVGAAAVTVRASVVRSVSVTPSSLALGAGQTVTAVATVDRDAGVAGTVTWASNATSVATVNASGLITAVAPGTAVITATSTADATKSAAIAVTVTALPQAVTSLTVAPTTASIAVNNTLAIVATAQVATGATAPVISYSTSNAGVATVNASGLVTAVTPGTAIITTKAKSTVTVGAATRTDSLLATTTITVGARASVSIASITQGNLPVNLAGVNGQIEANLNLNPGAEVVEKVEVYVNNTLAASQVYGVNGAPTAPVQLSINTAQFDANYVPNYLNGPATVVAKIYPAGASTPTASNTVQFTLTNADVVYFNATVDDGPAGLDHTGNSAVDGAGAKWWKGGFKFQAHPVSYSGQIASITYNSSTGEAKTGTGTPYAATFTMATIEGAQNITNALTVTYNAGYTLSAPPTAFMTAATPGYVPGKPVYATVSTNEDNVAPAIAVGNVAYNDNFDQQWVSASYSFAQDFGITDGGVGPNASTYTYLVYDAVTPACAGASVTTGNDLAETNSSNGTPDGYQLCAKASDLLGNAATSGATNYFGVDKVAPTVRAAGSTLATPAILGTVASASVSSVVNTTIYSIAAPFTATDVWGLEGIDTRSGFNQNVVAGFPAVQSMTLFNVANNPAASILCGFTGAMGTLLSDNFVRTPESAFDCGTAAPGYYTYSGHIVDRAGNASLSVDRNFAVDQYAPPVLSAILPASVNYVAGQPAAFNIYGTDDLEIIEADLTVTYPGFPVGVTYPLNAVSGAARWDALLNNTVTASSLSIGSWLGRVDMTCSAAAAPYAGCAAVDGITTVSAEYNNVGGATNDEKNPTGIAAVAYDVGSNASAPVSQALSSLITNDVAEQWSAADIITFKVTSTAGPIVVEHKSTTSISVPYFSAVALARIDGSGNAVICGVFPAAVRTDQGLNRFWTYTTAKPTTGPCFTAAGNWHAIGLKNNAALVTNGAP